MSFGGGGAAPELLETFSVTQRSSICAPYALLWAEYHARPSGSTRTT